MLEALTMSGLSPVALMESPSFVLRKSATKIAIIMTITAATISLYQLFGITVFAQVKTELQLKRFRLEANPITAMLIVYKPVLTMIPAKIDWIPILVCKNAVTKPEQIPASIAAKSASTG
jgi:hypothetical protein